jgi:hypothetical protein
MISLVDRPVDLVLVSGAGTEVAELADAGALEEELVPGVVKVSLVGVIELELGLVMKVFRVVVGVVGVVVVVVDGGIGTGEGVMLVVTKLVENDDPPLPFASEAQKKLILAIPMS